MKKTLLLLLWLGVHGLFATGARAADAATEAIEGAWVISVGNDPSERFMIVTGARNESGRVNVETAKYGWIDGKGSPVKEWNAQIAGDTIKLSFLSPADSKIAIEFRFDETTTSGTFVTKTGKQYEVRMTRIPAEELDALRAAAKLMAKPARPPERPHATADSRIYLVYVSAPDCPSCSGYQAEYFGRKDLMSKVVPDFPKITYVKSVLGTYRQPGQSDPVSTVPQELEWLKGKGPDGKLLIKRRGVPFFALVVDKKIWVQGHGTTALETLIAPEIRRAVAEKYASR